MKAKVVLGRLKKNGTKPVYLELIIKRKRVQINTKVSVAPENWDDKNSAVKGNSKEVNDDNLVISQALGRISDILVKYRLKNKDITPDQFEAEYSHPSYDIDFLVWMENEIRIKKNDVGPRRIIKYKTIFNKLKEFRSVITFSQIDHFFIEDFRGWLRHTKGNDVNTISGNLAVLKTFTTRAKRKGLIESDPFIDIRIGRNKADRTFCSEKELSVLWKIYEGNGVDLNGKRVDLKPYLRPVLRHFLFMCLTGLRISDFTALTFDHISNSTIRIYPIKTTSKKKEMVKIPLTGKAMSLILDEGNTVCRIFRPLTEQRMNFNLKTIAAAAGIKKDLTNHSARHTFATLFLEKTHDVATLQKLLGHSRIDETMVYVHITEKNLFDQMKTFEDSLLF